MRPAIKYACLFATVSILTKLVIFYRHLQFNSTADVVLVSSYLLFVLLSVFFGMRGEAILLKVKPSFLINVKSGMKSAAVYALIMAVFLFIYYKFIDTEYFSKRIADNINTLKSIDISLADSTNNKLGLINRDAMIENQINTAKMVFSPFYNSTFSLLGFLITGGIYSFLIALMQKLIFGKQS